MVQERLKELEEESRRALEARTAELEAEFNERIGEGAWGRSHERLEPTERPRHGPHAVPRHGMVPCHAPD